MAGKGRLILGIDLNASEICVTAMRGTWANPEVVAVGSAPMPPGALEGAGIINPEAIAEALRRVLNQMGVGTRDAVIGIPGRSVLTRVLDIPNVPDKEMGAVIQGELAHYKILRDNTGAFDYMRLQKPDDAPESSAQVLVMAAEETVVSSYRTVADLADLNIIALEPVLLAMYRVAFTKVQHDSSVLCLAISNGEVEITVLNQGQIRLYRRVDMGRNSLMTSVRPASSAAAPGNKPAARLLYSEDEEEAAPAEEASEEGTERQINVAAASSLVVEIQRSLDYYSSQYAQAEPVYRAVVATHDPELKPIAEWLAQALTMDTTVADLPTNGAASPTVFARLEASDGLRYLGAIGLAMRTLINPPASMPRFDLSTGQQKRKTIQFGRRSPAIALALSTLFLLVGLLSAFIFYHKASSLSSALEVRKAEWQRMQKVQQDVLSQMQAQVDQLHILAAKGLPVPRIMDSVASAVAPDTGLTAISLDSGGRLLITGEAANEKAIIRTLEALKSCPYFENTSLDGFDSKTQPNKVTLVRFQISSKLAGIGQPTPSAPGAH
jgi:type IV pilus assembly protein PilM